MVAIDLDGTLLSSQNQILNSSKSAIMSALSKGVKIILATGKARPGALAACGSVGLSGIMLVLWCVHGWECSRVFAIRWVVADLWIR